jgi:hypothetical protein
MGAVVFFYTAVVFGLRGMAGEELSSKIVMGLIFSLFLVGFVREAWKNIIYINSIAVN